MKPVWPCAILMTLALLGCGQTGQGAGGMPAGMAGLLNSMVPGIAAGADGPSPRFVRLAAADQPKRVVGIEALDLNGLMLFEAMRDGTETWIGADNSAVLFRSGMVVGTRGLGYDMMSSDIAASAALIRAARPGRAERFHAFLDGTNQVRRRAYICDVSSRGGREIDLGAGAQNVELMAEDCINPEHSFRNLYWVIPSSGRIVQSRQWAGPDVGPLAIRDVPN